MDKMKAVIIVGGGILQVPMIKIAQEYGFHVVVTDINGNAPGMLAADSKYVIDTYDVEEHKRLAIHLICSQHFVVQGVLTCGADVAPTVSIMAEILETPCIPYKVACSTHNKLEVRSILDAHGLGCFQPRWLVTEPHDYGCFKRLGGYPVVIKPTEQCASRGVTIVHSEEFLTQALRKSSIYSNAIIVEKYLSGTEHSAEAIFGLDGALVFFNIVDRIFDYADGIPLELGHINPSSLPMNSQEIIKDMLLKTAHALGINWGPYKIDLVMTTEGPYVLEITARLSGGFDCQGTSPLTGRHPLRTLLKVACGMETSGERMVVQPEGVAACAAILPQQSGRVVALPGVPAHQGETVVKQLIWAIQPGDMLSPAQHNGERAGFVLTQGATRSAAWGVGKYTADMLAAQIAVEPA